MGKRYLQVAGGMFDSTVHLSDDRAAASTERGAASNDRYDVMPASLAPANREEAPHHFDVYRTDQTRVSAMRFCGGDWHWRLVNAAGRTLVDAGGYRTEERCREAVTILQERAAFATFSTNA